MLDWTIAGLRPGLARSQVFERKGQPLGDGCYGQRVEMLPAASPVSWREYPVWHYGDLAVVFDSDRVLQLLGKDVELGGKPLDASLLRKMGLSEHHPLENLSQTYAHLPYRLCSAFPERAPRADSILLRDRLRASLPKLEESRALESDLQCEAEAAALASCKDWLRGIPRYLEWTPLALRRALWECLHCGPEYWQPTAVDWPVGHPIDTDSWQAEPAQIRPRLLVDAEIRRAQLRGLTPPLKVVLDEIGEAECAAVWQRLMLAGESPAAGLWRGSWQQQFWDSECGPLRLIDEGRATAELRWAAGRARLIDGWRRCIPYQYPGPPEGSFPLGIALADYPNGMSGWSWKGRALPDVELNWSNPVHRFHAMLTPEGAVLKPFSKDRLTPVLTCLYSLVAEASFERESWSADWCESLPGDDAERDLLRELERAPHFDRGIPHLAVRLNRVAQLVERWLPPQPTREQRTLMAGLDQTLRTGLKVLDVL